MSGYWQGKDGQMYKTRDEKIGADSRFEQNEKRNKELEKQNDLLERQARNAEMQRRE